MGTTTAAEEEEEEEDPSLQSEALCDTLLSVVDAVAYPYRAQRSGAGAAGMAEPDGYGKEALLSSLGDGALVHAMAWSAASYSTSASRALLGLFELVSGRSGRRGGAGGGGMAGPSFPDWRALVCVVYVEE